MISPIIFSVIYQLQFYHLSVSSRYNGALTAFWALFGHFQKKNDKNRTFGYQAGSFFQFGNLYTRFPI